jgi:hypothetical protein
MFVQNIAPKFARIKLKQAHISEDTLRIHGKVEISPGVYLVMKFNRVNPSYFLLDRTRDGGDMESFVPAKIRPTLPCLQGTVNRQHGKDVAAANETDASRQAKFMSLLMA